VRKRRLNMANKTTSSIYVGSGDVGVFTTPYGVCETAAGTAAKTVTVLGDFALDSGATVIVKFTNKNTASSPTLNVNNTGAKIIRYNNATITADYLAANRFMTFLYDGTYWQFVGEINTDTH
jgi:hypothetical protein